MLFFGCNHRFIKLCNFQIIHNNVFRCKNTSTAVVRRSKASNIPLTYERTRKPHQIGVMKSWNSWNTSNLKDEPYTSEVTLQDGFIRSFITGTFPTYIKNEVCL